MGLVGEVKCTLYQQVPAKLTEASGPWLDAMRYGDDWFPCSFNWRTWWHQIYRALFKPQIPELSQHQSLVLVLASEPFLLLVAHYWLTDITSPDALYPCHPQSREKPHVRTTMAQCRADGGRRRPCIVPCFTRCPHFQGYWLI